MLALCLSVFVAPAMADDPNPGDPCNGCAATQVSLGGTTLVFRNTFNPLDVAGEAIITSDAQTTSGKCSFQPVNGLPGVLICVKDPTEGFCTVSVTFNVELDGDTLGTTEVWRAGASGTVCLRGFDDPATFNGLNDTSWAPTVPDSTVVCGLGCTLEPTITVQLLLRGITADDPVGTKSWSPSVTFTCTGCLPVGVPVDGGGN